MTTCGPLCALSLDSPPPCATYEKPRCFIYFKKTKQGTTTPPAIGGLVQQNTCPLQQNTCERETRRGRKQTPKSKRRKGKSTRYKSASACTPVPTRPTVPPLRLTNSPYIQDPYRVYNRSRYPVPAFY